MISHVFHLPHYSMNPFALLMGVTAAAVILLGLRTLIRERRSVASLLFFVMTLPIGGWLFAFSWMYCATDQQVAFFWAKVAYLSVSFIPSSIYHFTVEVLRITPARRRLVCVSWLLSVMFAAAIVGSEALIHGLSHYWWGVYPTYGWLSVPYFLFFFGMMLLTFRDYWVAYCKSQPGTAYAGRVRALRIAFSIIYLASFAYVANYGIALYPFGSLPVLIFVWLVARAINRYHLVDITPALATKQILETMTDPLIVLDPDGVIRVVNPAACELLGSAEAALVDRPLHELAQPFLEPPQLERLVQTGAVQDHEVTWSARNRADGQKTFSLSASVMRDQAQQPMAIVCMLRDITERKQAEEALQRAHAELEQRVQERTQELAEANAALQAEVAERKRAEEALHRAHSELEGRVRERTKALAEANAALRAIQLKFIQAAKLESVGRLAAGVAHEVKNPLAIILMGVNYLSRHLATKDHRISLVLRDVKEAVRRADAIVKGLLDFSAPTQLQLDVENLHALIDRALLLLKHELDRSRITVVKQFARDLPWLRLDGGKVEQALLNIVMNAIHAMPKGGILTVRTYLTPYANLTDSRDRRSTNGFRPDEAVVVAEVDDTGIGIPDDTLTKVFDPFFTTKPTGKGTGLGLAVTHNILELHGGMIDIRNRQEGGVRVRMVFHAGAASHAGEQAPCHR